MRSVKGTTSKSHCILLTLFQLLIHVCHAFDEDGRVLPPQQTEPTTDPILIDFGIQLICPNYCDPLSPGTHKNWCETTCSEPVIVPDATCYNTCTQDGFTRESCIEWCDCFYDFLRGNHRDPCDLPTVTSTTEPTIAPTTLPPTGINPQARSFSV